MRVSGGEGVSEGAVVWLELDLIKSSAGGNREKMKDMAGSDAADIGVGACGEGRTLLGGSVGVREVGRG